MSKKVQFVHENLKNENQKFDHRGTVVGRSDMTDHTYFV